MVGHGGSSAGSYLADPLSPIPSHCALIVMTSTLRVKSYLSKNQSDALNHQMNTFGLLSLVHQQTYLRWKGQKIG